MYRLMILSAEWMPNENNRSTCVARQDAVQIIVLEPNTAQKFEGRNDRSAGYNIVSVESGGAR